MRLLRGLCVFGGGRRRGKWELLEGDVRSSEVPGAKAYGHTLNAAG